ETFHRLDQLFTSRRIACITDRKYHSFLSMRIFRQERKRRRLSQHNPNVQVIGHRLYGLAILLQNVLRLGEGKYDQAGQYIRADRIELKLKIGNDAKVAAAPANSPEEIWILGFTRSDHPAIGRYYIRREQIIDRHSIFPAEPAKAAAKSEPGNACCGINTKRCCQTKCLCFAIEVRKLCPGADVRSFLVCIDFYRVH